MVLVSVFTVEVELNQVKLAIALLCLCLLSSVGWEPPKERSLLYLHPQVN